MGSIDHSGRRDQKEFKMHDRFGFGFGFDESGSGSLCCLFFCEVLFFVSLMYVFVMYYAT
jgi:hypothetical protein